MAETGGLFILDGEDAGTTPWEFSSLVVGGTATFALDADAKNNGTYGYTAHGDGTNACYGKKSFAEQAEIYVRFYVYIPSTSSFATWDYPILAELIDGTDTTVWAFGVHTTSGPAEWFAKYDEASAQTSNTNFSVDAWHRVEIRFLSASSNGGIQVWIDGDAVAALSDFDNNSSALVPDNLWIGSVTAGKLGSGGEVFYDDIKADTSAIGEYSGASATSVIIAGDLHEGVFEQQSPVVSAIQSLFDVHRHVKMIF